MSAGHVPVHADAGLGYRSMVCAECNVDWPCHDAVLERCDRNLAADLPCSCGWHEDDEKVVQDPEQEKVTPLRAAASDEGQQP